jgi:hypothetical protein
MDLCRGEVAKREKIIGEHTHSIWSDTGVGPQAGPEIGAQSAITP